MLSDEEKKALAVGLTMKDEENNSKSNDCSYSSSSTFNFQFLFVFICVFIMGCFINASKYLIEVGIFVPILIFVINPFIIFVQISMLRDTKKDIKLGKKVKSEINHNDSLSSSIVWIFLAVSFTVFSIVASTDCINALMEVRDAYIYYSENTMMSQTLINEEMFRILSNNSNGFFLLFILIEITIIFVVKALRGYYEDVYEDLDQNKQTQESVSILIEEVNNNDADIIHEPLNNNIKEEYNDLFDYLDSISDQDISSSDVKANDLYKQLTIDDILEDE